MKLRILSGNLAGCIQDNVPQIEGEVMVATGYAEVIVNGALPSPASVDDELRAAGAEIVPADPPLSE